VDRTVNAAVSSNHAKAALLAVGGRLFQSFKGANPRIIDFGLPVESGLSFFLVAETEPLLSSEILDDHSQPSPFGLKSDGGTFTSINLNFFLIPRRKSDGQDIGAWHSLQISNGAGTRQRVCWTFATK
jgi:hypothetical protein